MNEMVNLTEPEKAWLACAIDGEGSITPSLSWYRKIPHFSILVMVCNTNYDFVSRAYLLLGTNGNIIDIKEATSNLKTMYIARLKKHSDIIEVLGLISPYLIIKGKSAEIAIDWCKYRLDKNTQKLGIMDYAYYLMLKSLTNSKKKNMAEVAQEFMEKIKKRCPNPESYLHYTIEGLKIAEELI